MRKSWRSNAKKINGHENNTTGDETCVKGEAMEIVHKVCRAKEEDSNKVVVHSPLGSEVVAPIVAVAMKGGEEDAETLPAMGVAAVAIVADIDTA